MSDTDGMDWLRLKVLIEQTENRIKLWEAEEKAAERRWHRGIREVDRRGLTNPGNIAHEYMLVASKERLWVPTDRLEADRDLLDHLYSLRDQMLKCTEDEA